jgi:hypothetical protein
MKILKNNSIRQRERGMIATVLFIALLAIMILLVAANGKALFQLHREVKFLEQQQIKRLNSSQTNYVAVANLNPK